MLSSTQLDRLYQLTEKTPEGLVKYERWIRTMEALASGDGSNASQRDSFSSSLKEGSVFVTEEKFSKTLPYKAERRSSGERIDERKGAGPVQDETYTRKRTHSDFTVTKKSHARNTPVERKGEGSFPMKRHPLVDVCSGQRPFLSGDLSSESRLVAEAEARAKAPVSRQGVIGINACQGRDREKRESPGGEEQTEIKREGMQPLGDQDYPPEAKESQRATLDTTEQDNSKIAEGDQKRLGDQAEKRDHSEVDRCAHTVSPKDGDRVIRSCHVNDRRHTKPDSVATDVEKREDCPFCMETVSAKVGGENGEVLVEASPADGQVHRIILSPPGVHTPGGEKGELSSMPPSLFIALGNRKETLVSSASAGVCEAAETHPKASGESNISLTLPSDLPASTRPPCSSPSGARARYASSSPLYGRTPTGLMGIRESAKVTRVTGNVSFSPVGVPKQAERDDFLSSQMTGKKGELFQSEEEEASFASQEFAEAETGFQKSEDSEDKDGKSEAASTTAGTTTCCTYTGGTTRRAMMLLMHGETDSTSVVSICTGGQTGSTSECPASDSFSDSGETPLTVSLHPRAHSSLSPLPSSPDQSTSVQDEAVALPGKPEFPLARRFPGNNPENEEAHPPSSLPSSLYSFSQEKEGDKNPPQTQALKSCDGLGRQLSIPQKDDRNMSVLSPRNLPSPSPPAQLFSLRPQSGRGVATTDGCFMTRIKGKDGAAQNLSLLSASREEPKEPSASPQRFFADRAAPPLSPEAIVEDNNASKLLPPRCLYSDISPGGDTLLSMHAEKEKSEESLHSSFSSSVFTESVHPDPLFPASATEAVDSSSRELQSPKEQEGVLEYRDGSDEARTVRQREREKEESRSGEDMGMPHRMNTSHEERTGSTGEAGESLRMSSEERPSLQITVKEYEKTEDRDSFEMHQQDNMQGETLIPHKLPEEFPSVCTFQVAQGSSSTHAVNRAKKVGSWRREVFQEVHHDKQAERGAEVGKVRGETYLPQQRPIRKNSSLTCSDTIRNDAGIDRVCETPKEHLQGFSALIRGCGEDEPDCRLEQEEECCSLPTIKTAGKLKDCVPPGKGPAKQGRGEDSDRLVPTKQKTSGEVDDIEGQEDQLQGKKGSLITCPPILSPVSPASHPSSTSPLLVRCSASSEPSPFPGDSSCQGPSISGSPAVVTYDGGIQDVSVRPSSAFPASSSCSSELLPQKQQDGHKLTKSSARTGGGLEMQASTPAYHHQSGSSRSTISRSLRLILSLSSAPSSSPSSQARIPEFPSRTQFLSACTTPSCPHVTCPSVSACTSITLPSSFLERHGSSPSSPRTACCLLSSAICPAMSPLTPACSSSSACSSDTSGVSSSTPTFRSLPSCTPSCTVLSSPAPLSSFTYAPAYMSSVLGYPPHPSASQPCISSSCSSSSSSVSLSSSSLQKGHSLPMASLCPSSEATTLCASPSPASSGSSSQVLERKPQPAREESSRWCTGETPKVTESFVSVKHKDAVAQSVGDVLSRDLEEDTIVLPALSIWNKENEKTIPPPCHSTPDPSIPYLSRRSASFPSPSPPSSQEERQWPMGSEEKSRVCLRGSSSDERDVKDISSCSPSAGGSPLTDGERRPSGKLESAAAERSCSSVNGHASTLQGNKGDGSFSLRLPVDLCPSLSVTFSGEDSRSRNTELLPGVSENLSNCTVNEQSAQDKEGEAFADDVSAFEHCSLEKRLWRRNAEGEILRHCHKRSDGDTVERVTQPDTPEYQETPGPQLIYEVKAALHEERSSASLIDKSDICVTGVQEETDSAKSGRGQLDLLCPDAEGEQRERKNGHIHGSKELHADEATEQTLRVPGSLNKGETDTSPPPTGREQEQQEGKKRLHCSEEQRRERYRTEIEGPKAASRSSRSGEDKDSSTLCREAARVPAKTGQAHIKNLFDRGFDSGVLVTHKEWS
ncbi:hypothetical protein CSUI_005246, partial [Cystoisospora suis]